MKTTRPPLARVAPASLPLPLRSALVMAAVLLAASFTSCSKHPPTPAASPKVADLGVVEVSDGGTNRVFSKDGRVFVVRSYILTDQKATIEGKETILKGQTIVLMISQEQTDTHGVTRRSPELNLGAKPGQTVGVSDGVVSVSITPRIKP